MNGSTSNEDEPITFVGIVPLTTTQPMRSAHCVSALWTLFCGTFPFLSLSAVSLVGAGADSLFFLSVTSRQLTFVKWPKKPQSSKGIQPWLWLPRCEKDRKRANTDKSLMRRFPATRLNDYSSFFCLRKEHNFLKSKGKYMKMQKQGRSKENSRKAKRKMLRAS